MIKDWIRLHDIDTLAWLAFDDIEAWWCSLILTNGGRRKGLASLLISWELWNKRNAWIFKNKSAMTTVVLAKIKA
jgi:hypothetical protein